MRAFGGATVGFECPSCKRIQVVPEAGFHWLNGEQPMDWAKRQSAECCGPWRCDTHGKELKRGHSCSECRTAEDAAKLQKKYESATKLALSEYDGTYLYREGFGREGFFRVDDLDDMKRSGAVPDWAFGCDVRTVTEDDCDLEDHVAEGVLSDHHEDAYDWVDDEKVKAASKLIFEACADIKTYDTDYSCVVLLSGEQG
ncbi:MAG TPA: hypothetical protein VER11_34340 [Polyangiaceae bacterium]|nr:hypothetical protein [Polyangiaceae bacterium]